MSRRGRVHFVIVTLAILIAVVPTATVGAANTTVTMKAFQFAPSPVTVRVGDTVTWVNKDLIAHKVAPDNGGFTGSSILQPGDSYRARMTKAGRFGFHDVFNPSMTGTIVVRAQVATAAPTATAKPKPTPKPTAKPTVKPAATAKATAKPAASGTTIAVAESPGPSEPPLAGGTTGGTGSTPPDATISGTVGKDGGIPIVVWLLLIGVVGIAFVGGIWFSRSRGRPSPAPNAPGSTTVPTAPPAAGPDFAAAIRRQPVPAQPAASETKPLYPSDVDEDSPLESRQRRSKTPDEPPADDQD